jgi:hypothetical protein
MKVMVFVKATQDSETGVMPNEQLLTEMGQYNEELARAGILLAAEVTFQEPIAPSPRDLSLQRRS